MTREAGVFGRKSGKAGGGTTEDPNTLQSQSTARLIEIVSHGECVGLANKTHPLQSVYFDGTQAQNGDTTDNYIGVTVDERVGLPNQDPFTGFNDVESEYSFSNRIIYHATPQTYTVSNTYVDAVRMTIQIDALSSQDSAGNIGGSSVTYNFSTSFADSAFTEVLSITLNDKCTSAQQLSYRIARPAGCGPTTEWAVMVTRVTGDSTTVLTQNQIEFVSATEITDSNLQYADMAGVAILADSEQFGSSIPTRSFDWVGMVLDVPSNYTPPNYNAPNDQTKRTYTGLWDGTFKRAWTDNPAWILWAMITDKDWGLGRAISPAQVDKWALYQIAQYCDAFVPDGYGGMEPRYTINTQIMQTQEAYAVLSSIVSVFRGLMYWGSGSVTFVADMPKDPVKLVTSANIINGEFNYQGVSLKSRHSVATVTWNDPTDKYAQAIEVVEDPDMLNRFGWRPIDVAAFGCTSRGQANRVGRWILYTEKYETETVTYQASMDHADVRPGDIIEVFDQYYAGVRLGGRVVGVTNTAVTIDQAITISGGQSYRVTLIRPDGSLVTRTLTNSTGPTTVLTFAEGVSETPATNVTVTIKGTAPFDEAVQRATIMASSTTSITTREAIVFEPNVQYAVHLTLADGSVEVARVTTFNSEQELQSITFSPALTAAPYPGSVGFVSPVGEGYQAFTTTSGTGTSLVISSPLTIQAGFTYVAAIEMPDGSIVSRTLNNSPGNVTTLTWDATEDVTLTPIVGSMWGVTSSNLEPRQFRVIACNQSSPNIIDVTALLYNPGKYALIEDGLQLPTVVDSIYQSQQVPAAPTNLNAYRIPVLQRDGTYTDTVELSWTPSVSILVNSYHVSYRYNSGAWVRLPDAFAPNSSFTSLGPGTYEFSIVAVNFLTLESHALDQVFELQDDRPFQGALIANIRLQNSPDVAQASQVIFTGADLKFQWDVLPPPDWINQSITNWQDPYLQSYQVRFLSRTTGAQLAVFNTTNQYFVLTKEQNLEWSPGGLPTRNIIIGVAMVDTYDSVYTEFQQNFYNPAPAAPTITVTGGINNIVVSVSICPDSDYSATYLWVSTTAGFNPVSTTATYNASQTNFTVPATGGQNYYIRAAHYDDYSLEPGDLNISDQYEAVVTSPSSGTNGARLGVNLFDQAGTAILNDVDVITDQGQAASIVGQGTGATTNVGALATLNVVDVAHLAASTGGNACVDTNFYYTDVYWTDLNNSTGVAYVASSTTAAGIRVYTKTFVATSSNAQTFTIGQGNSTSDVRYWAMPVSSGQIVEASGYLAGQALSSGSVIVYFYDYTGAEVTVLTVASNTLIGTTNTGVSSMDRVGGYVTVPSNAAFALIGFVGVTNGDPTNHPFLSVAQPVLRIAGPAQTTLTPYTPGVTGLIAQEQLAASTGGNACVDTSFGAPSVYWTDASNSTGIAYTDSTLTSIGVPVRQRAFASTVGTGKIFNLGQLGSSDVRPWAMPITAGTYVEVSAWISGQALTYIFVYVDWLDVNGSLLSVAGAQTTTSLLGSGNAGLVSMVRVGGFLTAPTSACFAVMGISGYTNGDSTYPPFLRLAKPLLRIAGTGQLGLTSWTPGVEIPSVAVASTLTAGAIVGQAPAATGQPGSVGTAMLATQAVTSTNISSTVENGLVTDPGIRNGRSTISIRLAQS